MDEPDDASFLRRGSTDPGEIGAYYDAWATKYDDDVESMTYRAPGVIAQYLAASVALDAEVFDAGCGTGLVGAALRRQGFTGPIDGVDVSQDSLDIAAERTLYRSLATANLQAGVDAAADSYDALVCVGVMSYLPDVARTWTEFARVVRPGGVVAFTQRTDRWVQRQCAAVVADLAAAGVWEPIEVTDRQPYLPDDPDHTDELEVHYVVARIS